MFTTTKAADKQPNQNDSSKSQESYKGQGVQNKQPPSVVNNYLIKNFVFFKVIFLLSDIYFLYILKNYYTTMYAKVISLYNDNRC